MTNRYSKNLEDVVRAVVAGIPVYEGHTSGGVGMGASVSHKHMVDALRTVAAEAFTLRSRSRFLDLRDKFAIALVGNPGTVSINASAKGIWDAAERFASEGAAREGIEDD